MLPAPSPSAAEERWHPVEVRMRQLGNQPDGLIEVLHAVQEAYGHLPTDALARVAAALGVPLSAVYGVATFYSHFTLAPRGRHVCEVCTGTACHISGGAAVLAALQGRLRTAPGTTSPDGSVSLLTTRCPGTCSLAPMMVVDGAAVGPVTAEQALAAVESL
jgi:bidirectional [NiFe] hydrogenase diaphorase subunit